MGQRNKIALMIIAYFESEFPVPNDFQPSYSLNPSSHSNVIIVFVGKFRAELTVNRSTKFLQNLPIALDTQKWIIANA